MDRRLILILFLGVCGNLHAQKPERNDSSAVYREIESYSERSKFSKFVYDLFFKPINTMPPVPGKIKHRMAESTFKDYEGKVIRNIQVITQDPFGYFGDDGESVKQNILFRAGNRLHIRTQSNTIRNLLLFRKNEPFDSLLVRESERLVRNQNFVHDVYTDVRSAGEASDSVDIIIHELDNWSLNPEIGISASLLKVDATEKNMFGLGHRFKYTDTWYSRSGINAWSAAYTVPGFRNTFITTGLNYEVDEYTNYTRSLSLERPFFSPFAKWAAGVFLATQFKKDSMNISGDGYVPVNLKFNTGDYWAGIATRVFKGRTEKDRTTNLILAARAFQVRYSEHPEKIYDSLQIYSNEYFYLGTAGVSMRKYVRDRYIFKYGLIEDVPAGKVYAITFGYQVKNNIGRTYLGVRYSAGNYNRLGFFSTTVEYGTFIRDAVAEQGIISAGLHYFTGLFEFGKWRIRQFIKPQLTLGLNRLSYERLTINGENGIRGFTASALSGTNKFVLTLQTQSYAPWSILGFHFGPYIIYSMGMLGDENGFIRSRVYSQYGAGVLIKNEFLVFDNFQISLAFYPYIPEAGSYIFKINPNSSNDFGFNSFEIGKPSIVVFQ